MTGAEQPETARLSDGFWTAGTIKAGANTLLVSLNRGSMPHEMFLNQIRRFGREVMPRLQAHQVMRVPIAEVAAAQ